jgi:hypothetical protein
MRGQQAQGTKHTTRLICAVLKMGDIGLASLVGEGILAAPLGGDPAEVAAGILALSVVAHLESEKLKYMVLEKSRHDRRELGQLYAGSK